MMRRQLGLMMFAVAVVVAGCAVPKIPPAIVGVGAREIDEPCNPANATLGGPTNIATFGPTEFAVPQKWIPYFKSLNELDFDLRQLDGELNVWKGGKFTFGPILPINSSACEIARGDTTISIRTTVLVDGIRRYRVDVSWAPMIEGQYMYMQLQTRSVAQLRELRGVIEGVRFPVRTATAR
jgi:hypothetical protein